jgi:hypothetical protein
MRGDVVAADSPRRKIMHKYLSSLAGSAWNLTGGIVTLGMLSVAGCSGEGMETDLAEASEDEPGKEQGALRAGGGSLPWRGATPDPIPMTTLQFGKLNVVYSVDIGMTRVCTGGFLGVGQTCHHELRGLQVCQYTPSNPNNFYTAGDPTNCTIVGQGSAGSWTRQTCAGGTVVSGYSIYSRSTRVEKLGMVCRDLVSGVSNAKPLVGSTDILFGDHLSCGDYIGGFQVNRAGNGMQASCVLKQ